jgi:FkbM family methyltransferase
MVKVHEKTDAAPRGGEPSYPRIRPVFFMIFTAFAMLYREMASPSRATQETTTSQTENNNGLTTQVSQSFLRLTGGLSVANDPDQLAAPTASTSIIAPPPPTPITQATTFGCTPLEKRLTQKAIPDAKTIICATKCPDSSAWLNDYLGDASETEAFIFLNFGCNKGYDSLFVAETITRKTEVFNPKKWAEAIGIGHPGNCFQGASENNSPIDPTLPKRLVEVHCIEAMPQTAEKLTHAADITTAKAHGLHTYNYAMTGTAGGATILFPNPTNGAGVENLGMHHCRHDATKHQCKEVPTRTVDEFVQEYVDISVPNRRIPFISIDVEGFDATVLQGSKETLKRTDYLEFEYHGQGDWLQQKLEDTVNMLKDYGFVCYWAGVNQLWRMSDTCWHNHFEFHMWSNVACVAHEHQPKLAAKMEQVFEDTLVQGTATTTC